MSKFKLTLRAKDNLKKTYKWGVERWGKAQAKLFVEGLYLRLEFIAKSPFTGKARPELHHLVRSSVHKGYVIFYIPKEHHIEVVSILRSCQDIAKNVEGLE